MGQEPDQYVDDDEERESYSEQPERVADECGRHGVWNRTAEGQKRVAESARLEPLLDVGYQSALVQYLLQVRRYGLERRLVLTIS